MGQSYGKAKVNGPAIPFVNLPENVIHGLWEDFNHISEGFGIERKRFCGLIQVLEMHMASNDDIQSQNAKLQKLAKKLFDFLDTDRNGIVDGLECLAGLAILSNMPLDEKLDYILHLYDFERKDRLVEDEMSMATACLCTALEKMTNMTPPSGDIIENTSKHAFHNFVLRKEDETAAISDIVQYVLDNPDTLSFVRHFDNIDVAYDDMVIASPYDARNDSNLGISHDNTRRTLINTYNNRRDNGFMAKLREKALIKPFKKDDKNTWRNFVDEMKPSRYEDKVKKTNQETVPLANYALDHIHGVSSFDGSHTDVLYGSDTDKVVFSAGAICIVYDSSRHVQKYFDKHNDQVTALAVSNNKQYAASGEVGANPSIYIWRMDFKTMFEAKIIGIHKNAILALHFSLDDTMLFTCGQDPYHSVAIYKLDFKEALHERASLMFVSRTTDKPFVGGRFVTVNGDFFTYGYEHYSFWSKDPKDGWVEKQGIFHRSIGKRTIICASTNYEENRTVCGCSSISGNSGDLIMFKNNDRYGFGHIRAHIGNVHSVNFGKEFVVSGGADGLIKVFTSLLTLVAEFDVSVSGSIKNVIKSLQLSDDEKKILFRTPGTVAEMSRADGLLLNEHPLIQAHCEGELWGLTTHPSRYEYCTVGDDATIRIYDMVSKKMLKSTKVPGWAQSPARCATYSPKGHLLAVGLSVNDVLAPPPPMDVDPFAAAEKEKSKKEKRKKEIEAIANNIDKNTSEKKSGAWFILDEESLEVIFHARDSLAGISAIAFSPNGKVLAVASFDYLVYMYNAVDNEFNVIGRCLGHVGPPTHLDFSIDSKWIQSTSCTVESGEVRWFDGETSEPNSSHNMFIDTMYQKNNSPFNWQVHGMWNHDVDEAFVTSCAIQTIEFPNTFIGKEEIVAAGDMQGRLRLFSSPVVCEDGQKPYIEFHGHVGGVTNVAFAFAGKYMISTGRNGRCIFQYSLHNSETTMELDEILAEDLENAIIPELEEAKRKEENKKDDDEKEEDALEEQEIDIILQKSKPEALLNKNVNKLVKVKAKKLEIGPVDTTGFCIQEYTYENQKKRTNLYEETSKFDLEEKIVEGHKATKSIIESRNWGKACVLPKEHSVSYAVSGMVEQSDQMLVDTDTPLGELELKWIYGLRTEGLAGMSRYCSMNEIIYNAGSHVVIQKIKQWQQTDTKTRDGAKNETKKNKKTFMPSQRHFSGHTSEIISLDIIKTKHCTLVATGDVAEIPTIIIWNLQTLKTEVTMRGSHRNGVKLLHFSTDGEKLASVGGDENQLINVYDTMSGAIIHCISGGRFPIFDLSFSLDSRYLLQTGMHTISFHDLRVGKNVLTFPFHLECEGLPNQPFLSSTWTDKGVVVGGWDGTLYDIDVSGYNALSEYEESEPRIRLEINNAHGSVINIVRKTKTPRANFTRVISAGDDGQVKIWSWHVQTNEFQCIDTFDIAQYDCLNPCIRSVDLDMEHRNILVTVLSSEILELHLSMTGKSTVTSSDVIVEGHYMEGEHETKLQDIAVHPKQHEFATVGDDKWLRVWDAATHKPLRKLKLESHGCCIIYSPSGEDLCVGLGPAPGKKKGALKAFLQLDGAFQIINDKKMALKHTGRDTRSRLTCARYTPDGSTLIIGASDRRLYMYDVNNEYELLKKLTVMDNTPRAMDISDDSKYIRTYAVEEQEIAFIDIEEGKLIERAASMREVIWDTNSCPYRWGTAGMWAAEETGRDLVSVDQSDMFNIIVGVDECGKLHLTRSPCTVVGRAIRSYLTTISSEGKVRILCNGASKHIITTGCTDRLVYQWEFIPHRSATSDRSGVNPNNMWTKRKKLLPDRYGNIGNRPWQSNLLPPSQDNGGKLSEDKSPPNASAKLKHVFGINPHSIAYNRRGNFIYCNAAVGIVYDKLSHQQQFYFNHAPNKITSLCVDENGYYVATGEETDCPVVRIWDASTCAHICTLPKVHRNGIKLLRFSRSGKHLVSVDDDINQKIAVWETDFRTGNWAEGRLKSYQNFGKLDVMFAIFTECCEFHGTGGYDIITGGVSHVTLWRMAGTNLIALKTFREYASPFLLEMDRHPPIPFDAMLCGEIHGKDVVTGSDAGDLYVFHTLRGEITQRIEKAHENPITAIKSRNEIVVTGDTTGLVKLWNNLFELIEYFQIEPSLAKNPSKITAIGFDLRSELFSIATINSEVYEISVLGGGGESQITRLIQGHSYWTLCGLDRHPKDPNIIVTTGDDSSIRVWSTQSYEMLRCGKLAGMCRAIAWSPCGKFFAIGLGAGSANESERTLDGSFQILDAQTFALIYHGRDSQQWITDIKYSPDGNFIAMASFDSKIYVYDATRDFILRAVSKRHNGFVTHIDFSLDGKKLMSNSGFFELFFHKMDGPNFKDGDDTKELDPDDARDINWPNKSCTLAWYTRGAWAVEARPVPVNTVHVSDDSSLLVGGYDDGRIKLFKFPAWTKGQESIELLGHAPQIGKVLFLNSEEKETHQQLISIGAKDRAVFVWNVEHH